MTYSPDRQNMILGRQNYATSTKYACFLPFRGEFGWYIQTFVKRVQGYNHPNKIVCTKLGHECLFPTAQNFYYDWQDVKDGTKAGITTNEDEDILKRKIIEIYGTDDITFLSPKQTSWEEKASLASCVFIPQSLHNLGLKTDIVIAPRNRTMDPHRNWKQENWQLVVDELVGRNYTVGVCGARETSFPLEKISHCSYHHIDVDSDVEMMNNAKLIICQESGLLYLSFLCCRPTFVIDHYLHDSDQHRNLSIPFKTIPYTWGNPMTLVEETLRFLEGR